MNLLQNLYEQNIKNTIYELHMVESNHPDKIILAFHSERIEISVCGNVYYIVSHTSGSEWIPFINELTNYDDVVLAISLFCKVHKFTKDLYAGFVQHGIDNAVVKYNNFRTEVPADYFEFGSLTPVSVFITESQIQIGTCHGNLLFNKPSDALNAILTELNKPIKQKPMEQNKYIDQDIFIARLPKVDTLHTKARELAESHQRMSELYQFILDKMSNLGETAILTRRIEFDVTGDDTHYLARIAPVLDDNGYVCDIKNLKMTIKW